MPFYRLPLLWFFVLAFTQLHAQALHRQLNVQVDGTQYTVTELEANYQPISDDPETDWVLNIALTGQLPQAFAIYIYATVDAHGTTGTIHCVCKSQQGFEDGKVYGKLMFQTDLVKDEDGYGSYQTLLDSKDCEVEPPQSVKNVLVLKQLDSRRLVARTGVEYEREIYSLIGEVEVYDPTQKIWRKIALNLSNFVL